MARNALLALILLTTTTTAAHAETIVRVTTEQELRDAFNSAGAGTTIVIADGTYVLNGILWTRAAGTAAAPIKMIAENSRRAILESNGFEEAIRLVHGYWWLEGLVIRATGSSNYGVKLEADGHHARIRANTFEIHPGSEAGIKGAGGPSYPWPDHAIIERNWIYMTAPTTYFMGSGINAVAVQGWQVRDNRIWGIKRTGDGIAYGIMIMGNAIDPVIERNTIWDTFIGITLGGGGTGSRWMRNGALAYESRNGIIRNNVVSDSIDVAMYLYAANNTQIYNNTTYNSFTSCGSGCSAIHVRMPGSTADVQNNILDKRVFDRDGGTHTANNNLSLPSSTYRYWFQSVASQDFRLTPGCPARDAGIALPGITLDVARRARPLGGAIDIGATEQ